MRERERKRGRERENENEREGETEEEEEEEEKKKKKKNRRREEGRDEMREGTEKRFVGVPVRGRFAVAAGRDGGRGLGLRRSLSA